MPVIRRISCAFGMKLETAMETDLHWR